ncbi:MAG TPA: phosphatase PAP2 family protein [Mycobacteriales bacterium]
MAAQTEERPASGPAGRRTDTVPLTRRTIVSLALEVALVAVLLVLYREGRSLARHHVTEAQHNAAWLWHVERALHLPNEADLQHWLLTSTTLVHLADRYYVGVHFPLTAAFLVWLWVRHHNRYGRVRTTLAITTGLGLLITVLVPLAPPRLFGGDGLVDTMQVFGPSAYNANATVGLANQYAAMPSLHIAWSVLVAATVVLVSTRVWRWVVLAHPIVTTFVVIATANHYWSDGLVAVVILGVSAAAVYRPQWFVRPFRRSVAR